MNVSPAFTSKLMAWISFNEEDQKLYLQKKKKKKTKIAGTF